MMMSKEQIWEHRVLIRMDWNIWMKMREEKHWRMRDWIRMSMIFKKNVQMMYKIYRYTDDDNHLAREIYMTQK